MHRVGSKIFVGILLLLALVASSALAQSRGLEAIRAADMKVHLEFLSAREFDGRSAPSTALNIASRYIALQARRIGLKPLLPDGSYLQHVPVEITTISPAKSRLKVFAAGGEQTFYFPQSFGVNARDATEGAVSGSLVFLGTALGGPAAAWSQLVMPDLKGKIAIVLDVPPQAGVAQGPGGVAIASARQRFLLDKGAIALVTIITAERERNLSEKALWFDISERLRFPDVETRIPGAQPAAPQAQLTPPQSSFIQVDVRHDAAASILGLSRAELDAMFASAAQAHVVAPKEFDHRILEIGLSFDTRLSTTPNVVGWIEGSDTKLREEYVVIGAHHDHNPTREGRIYPGADDDGSGTVAMFSLAEALMLERPRRSVVFVWNTAEERGLIGAYYFVQHCPVPVEKISANLNLDMISRNDPNMIYLIGSNKISSELDASIREMNDRSVQLKLDYTYEAPTHPDRFFFRSDQYPYIRYGIPAVWFFCGTTSDYHQETDSLERADLAKAEKVTRLVYLVCLDIGNKPALLKLDVNPEITTRGSANMKINWQRPPQQQ